MKYKDRCYDYQCLNGGQCVENNGLPVCKCARQYHGCHCEQKGKVMRAVTYFQFRPRKFSSHNFIVANQSTVIF